MGALEPALINHLIEWLNKNRPTLAPYTADSTKRYFRVVFNHGDAGQAALCFVVKSSFRNKSVGAVRTGDILYPKTWNRPARHTRGSVLDPSGWSSLFSEYGMKGLR